MPRLRHGIGAAKGAAGSCDWRLVSAKFREGRVSEKGVREEEKGVSEEGKPACEESAHGCLRSHHPTHPDTPATFSNLRIRLGGSTMSFSILVSIVIG